MKFATLISWRNHALAVLSTAFILSTGPSAATAADPVAATETLWRSYDIAMQTSSAQGALSSSTGTSPTVVDFYESTNDGGIGKGALLAGYFAGVHPDTFNRTQQVWSSAGSWLYPYVGKSTVNRGSDIGETNTPTPTGVRDLQMHPPNSAHLIVAAVRVPQSGDYSVVDLAVRRVNDNPGQTARLRVFNGAGTQIANLQASGPGWVRGAASYAAGTQSTGSYIYFAVDRDGSFAWDATEVAFTVRATSSTPPPSCNLMPTPSSVTVGGSASLAWTTTNATALTINQGIGVVAPVASGSRTISPTTTTIYTASVTGPAGTTTCAATVTVGAAPAETLWRSSDIAIQASSAQGALKSAAGTSPTVVDFYESTNDGGIAKGSLLQKYTLGVHPDTFNRAQQIWSAGPGSWLYSYVGKSTVNRGSDLGETNAPTPNGGRDLQMHPPNSARLIVAAFRAPQAGNYSVVDLAARRVDGSPGQTSRLRVFNGAGAQIANLQASGQSWVRGAASYSVGALSAGSYIYFAVDGDGSFAWDATEVAFTVRATSSTTPVTPVTPTPPVVVKPPVTPPTTPPVVVVPPPKTSPHIAGTPKTATKANEAYSFIPSASDADGDKLTFSIANRPAWLTFSSVTGALTGTPAEAQVGIYRNVTIQVGSGGEYDTLPAFDIEVASTARKGVTLSWTPPTQNDDGTALSNLAGYKIRYGQQPGVYTTAITVANPGIAAYMVEGLLPGTYYFVITAYNTKGVESTVSNETTKKL